MRSKTTLVTLLLTITSFYLVLTSCSSGPKGPEMGTPAFYWLGAKESWAAGDVLKTADNLDRAMKGSKEHEAEARPWSLVLTSGLVKGYMELADNFEAGSRTNRTNPGAFRRQMSDYRRLARILTLQFAERYLEFEKTAKTDQIPLAFTFPSGTQAQPNLMTRISNGMLPAAPDLESAQKAMLQRGVILATTRAAGAGEDSSKASQLFKSGDVKVARNDFMLAMAYALEEQSSLFGPKKLDEPDKMKMLAQEAKDAMQGIPASKEVKALSEKIEKALKGKKG